MFCMLWYGRCNRLWLTRPRASTLTGSGQDAQRVARPDTPPRATPPPEALCGGTSSQRSVNQEGTSIYFIHSPHLPSLSPLPPPSLIMSATILGKRQRGATTPEEGKNLEFHVHRGFHRIDSGIQGRRCVRVANVVQARLGSMSKKITHLSCRQSVPRLKETTATASTPPTPPRRTRRRRSTPVSGSPNPLLVSDA
jgi:hypothetical protein